jgi:hypothetical protein
MYHRKFTLGAVLLAKNRGYTQNPAKGCHGARSWFNRLISSTIPGSILRQPRGANSRARGASKKDKLLYQFS